MRNFVYLWLLLLVGVSCKNEPQVGSTVTLGPPFSGGSYIEPDIIGKNDPSTYDSLAYKGKGTRTLFDQRIRDEVTVEAFLFQAYFNDNIIMNVMVNPEFVTDSASAIVAAKYAKEMGKLPRTLRLGSKSLTIHKGYVNFAYANSSIIIHDGEGDDYDRNGWLEEVLIHEATHATLDFFHSTSAGWIEAQDNDPTFISIYARNFPDREDLAETVPAYLAVTFRADRISETTKNKILNAIPNRIAYLDKLTWNIYPWKE